MRLSIRKHGGRQVVELPEGSMLPNAPRHVVTNPVSALLKALALARAFRWNRLLNDGTYASVSDIARAAKLDRTHLGDGLRLTLLAPWVVEAIQEGQQRVRVMLHMWMQPFAISWATQRTDTNRLNA